MKNLSLLIMVIIGAILTSCTFTEKIYIEENGSGLYQVDMDLSQMLAFAGSLTKSEEGKDDSVIEKALEKTDTTFYFGQILEQKKDSISKLPLEQRLMLESLKDSRLKMIIDEKESKFIANFYTDFKDISEAKDMQNKASNALALASNKEGLASKTVDVSYVYTDKIFQRTISTEKRTKKEQQEYDKNLEEMSMFLMGSTYNLEYHFPKPIKTTTAKDATFSNDRKTIYLSFSMDEIIKNESLLNFEVKF